MSEPVYIGIDVGTQSVRVMAVTADGAVSATASHPLSSRREGVQHEQDPEQWWSATVAGLRQVMGVLEPRTAVLGLAVDATSGTILLADEHCRALTPGLMYDDGRASREAAAANEAGATLWQSMSYRMQASWALPKLMWLLRSTDVPKGALLLHQNDWVNARLAGRVLYADSSHALKTGYNLIAKEWPEAILDELGVPRDMLPEVCGPGVVIGTVSDAAASETGLPLGTPILSGMTDGCAAQIASGATREGDWNTVVGTTLVVKGVTQDLLHDPTGVVYSHRSADGLWLPGGASSTGAAAIAKEFGGMDLAALNSRAVADGPTPVVVYPLVSKGERFPFSEPAAEGFTLGNADSVEERYRAVLQGIALWERLCFDMLRALGADTGGRFSISGGAAKSEALNTMRADVLERDLILPSVTEGAFGMAVLAASADSSLGEATARMVKAGRIIEPQRPFSAYAQQYGELTEELNRRGWLPGVLQAAAPQGARS